MEETVSRINGVDLEEEKEDSDERDTEDSLISSSTGATLVTVEDSVDNRQENSIEKGTTAQRKKVIR